MITVEYLRQFKISEYAVFDFLISFLAVFLLAPFLTKLFLKVRISVPKANWLYLVVPLSILFHIIFKQMTPLTENFLDVTGYYVLKIIVVFLLIMGFRGVKVADKTGIRVKVKNIKAKNKRIYDK